MQSFINKLKFCLGLKCVVRYGESGWVMTKREFGILRVCKSTKDTYWWMNYVEDYCIFTTKELAQKAMETKLLRP